MNMTTIVVTGASGFAGRNISKYLIQQGHEVVGLSRSNPHIMGLNFRQTDLTDISNLPTEFRTATVVHCAALTADGKSNDFINTNYFGTINALQINPEGKFIHLSSSSIYDLSTSSELVEEDEFRLDKYKFYNDYSLTKSKAEQYLLDSEWNRTVAPISLRPHGIYGEDDTTLLPRLMERIKVGSITLPNGGNVLHSLTNIQNLIHGVEQAMNYDNTTIEAFNITDAEPVLISSAIQSAAKEDIKISSIPTKMLLGIGGRLAGVSEYEARQLGFNRTYSIEKAKTVLGYNPSSFQLEWLG